MSVFTNKRDAEKVPVLNQLAQIDVGSNDELEKIFWRVAYLNGLNRLPEPPIYVPTRSVLSEVGKICGMVRRTLLSLAEGKSVPADCLLWLNNYGASVQSHFEIIGSTPGNYGIARMGNELIDLSRIVYTLKSKTPVCFFNDGVFQPLQKLVLNAAYGEDDGESFALICIGCGSPAVIAHSEQMYCSARCCSRIFMRKKRNPVETPAVCPACKQPFTATYPTQIYCSKRCSGRIQQRKFQIRNRSEEGGKEA